MSSLLLATALEHDDGSSNSECEAAACDKQDEEPLQEAMSHTATEGMHMVMCSGDPTKGGNKKKQSEVACAGKPANKCKVDATFIQADGRDCMLQCIFADGECIPLWPQYVHRTTEWKFVRVDRQEPWVIQLIVASRKYVLRGYEPQKHVDKHKPFARSLISQVCNDLLREFRRAVVEAKKMHKESTGEQFPDVLAIRIHDCEVIAPVHARHFHIRADENAVKWIQTGFRRAVKDYLAVELQAISHTAAKVDGGKPMSMLNMRAGVRDKIRWVPESCSWRLKFKGADGMDLQYCNENGISLTIPPYIQKDEFKEAREKTFHDACLVWNAVDKSGRRRIKLSDRPLNVQMVPVNRNMAMSHTESDCESEASRCFIDDPVLFGDGDDDDIPS